MRKLVKIFFKNGSSAEGIIKKHTKKKLILKTVSGNKLLVFNPSENIIMIVYSKDVNEKVEIKPNHIPTRSMPVTIEVDQLWMNSDDESRWIVTDMISNFVTLQDINSEEVLDLDCNDLLSNQSWKLDTPAAIVISQRKPVKESVEDEWSSDLPEVIDNNESFSENSRLKAKNLAELHLLKKQSEVQHLSKKINTFTPTNGSQVTTYGFPNFSKHSITNGSSTKNS